MSGLGGGGIMLVYVAAEDRTYAVDYTMVAPQALNPADYPLVEGADNDLFGWPSVEGDRNVHGPLSFAVPGAVAGLSLALERFGTVSFKDAIAPGVAHAEAGMGVDWYASLKIASGGPTLARYPESAKTYLPNGFVPCGEWGGELPRIQLGNLAETYQLLHERGPQDFYTGEVARRLVADMQAVGGKISADDLSRYGASINDVAPGAHHTHTIYAAPGLTAGPTLLDTLARLRDRWPGADAPDAATYKAYANSLHEAYAHRLATMGEADDSKAPGCTTHMSAVDAEGNVVALTQTLLSVFGSKVMLPATGILMNNGVMWFDPRPGRPNSMAPGRRPLANMCPTIVERADGARFALGASGGRRIMPTVFQLTSFLTDFGMTLEDAMHQGRVDVSTAPYVGVDRRLGEEVLAAVAEDHTNARAHTHGVYPALYACPNTAAHLPDGTLEGSAFIMSPWSYSATAEEI